MIIFTDGKLTSIMAMLKTLETYAGSSGLRINIDKSTIYMAGIPLLQRQTILKETCLSEGTLPVRYLGLPLMTRQMTVADYGVLVEKIRNRISNWTTRYLSYAGRLQLISSILMSITNFWMSAFRLPKACTLAIEKICSAFLWSGPDLNSHKAKVSWNDICRPKSEGGLGLRPLTDTNRVACLKLVWRVLSRAPSLWIKWLWTYMIPNGNFWAISANSNAGSWMWRKLLKYRDIAKQFHRIDVKNGAHALFWFDHWCDLGRLVECTPSNRHIDLGIPINATVQEALTLLRRRNFRHETYNLIGRALQALNITPGQSDHHLWRRSNEIFRPSFSTKSTYHLLRNPDAPVTWFRFIWFPYHTPKYSFISWLAVLGRLSTGDKMKCWDRNHNPTCVLCGLHEETRDHLFFLCRYTSAIWSDIGLPLLDRHFTTNWTQLQENIRLSRPKTLQFLIHYALQSTIYHIWRERNTRRHEDKHSSKERIIKLIDKNIRNRLSSIRQQDCTLFPDGFTSWFATRRS